MHAQTKAFTFNEKAKLPLFTHFCLLSIKCSQGVRGYRFLSFKFFSYFYFYIIYFGYFNHIFIPLFFIFIFYYIYLKLKNNNTLSTKKQLVYSHFFESKFKFIFKFFSFLKVKK